MKTIPNILICLLLFCPNFLLAQWHDDFSDGDFEDNPVWSGNTDRFIVDNGWLRLNASSAGTSYLSVVSDIISEASWEFEFKMSFTPSSANYAKVYLVSDRSDLIGPLNGYFLRLGSADRDICLFRQNGNTIEKLISGRLGSLNASTNHVRVSITRDNQGYWTLKTDLSGGRNFTLEGGALDNNIKASAYFGVVCTYTATRTTGFFFDNFNVEGQPYVDTEKPVVTSCSVVDGQVRIRFSEAMTSISPPYDRFFDISGIAPSADVTRDDDLTSFRFPFPQGLNCGIRYKLSVGKLSDLSGNVMRDTVLNISAPCSAVPYDIVINEIMANPTPSVRLPEYEYIELYNRSGKNIELEGWTFTYGNTSKTFLQYLFPSGGYLLLVHPNAQPDMAGYGATLPLLGSQTAITNTGQYLQLKDRSGAVISWVDFTDDWYVDPLKSGGGWSLEQIDPEQACIQMRNWKASIGKNGGTPGTQNSVFKKNTDSETPEIQRIAVPNNRTVILYVSKPIGNPLPLGSEFALNPEIPVEEVRISGKHYDQLQLSLRSSLSESNWYDLSINGKVYDCAGYETTSRPFRFSPPQDVDSLDVVINEILFRPTTDGASFIELYNRSSKAVRTSDLQLSLRNANGKLSSPAALTDDPFLLLPDRYLVVSRNTEAVIQQFGADNRGDFLKMSNMPSLGKESGRIVLLNKSLRIVDEVHYDSKQHADFLKIADGVSLERLHPDRASLDPSNWHTAAQTVGFGTPGKQNSQYTDSEATGREVSLNPDVFSPDNDGYEDVLNIHYAFNEPSLMAEVIIFDSSGRKIRQLVRKQLAAKDGIITWDGSDDNGRKVLTGVYIVWFRVYNSTGTDKIFKLPCVSAGKKR